MTRLDEARDRVEANPPNLSTGKRGVREHNKRVGEVWDTLRELATTPEGRVALEDLARDSPSIGLRVMTANMIMRWDGFLARDVLEEIVSSGGGQVVRPMSMSAALQAPYGVQAAALSLLNLNLSPE